jgi:hypothetical protein
MILACCVSWSWTCQLTPGHVLHLVHSLDRRVVQQVYAPPKPSRSSPQTRTSRSPCTARRTSRLPRTRGA